ncbi:hypothetical protein HYH03_013707 [Edaphochlamys debaryana]|uniref:Kazal-like domain-containing protein n=1 Tax=Edaphochlamys debaryana TaxID=47281 RepID=A0A836BU89_9CHLO|nr:hypothetical protein HYH03_013707 [Edaphochlamys debaryana]|eukprot:KAG2487708.1 hypothetical protein HYH03_013707 [Edaphochlamys debaryana]
MHDCDNVCGADGRNYCNACIARCNKVPVVWRGECDALRAAHKRCLCPEARESVCGTDGVTYANACYAGCNKVEVDYIGNCADDTGCNGVLCPMYYEPACGANGVLYSNKCFAACAGITLLDSSFCGITADM